MKKNEVIDLLQNNKIIKIGKFNNQIFLEGENFVLEGFIYNEKGLDMFEVIGYYENLDDAIEAGLVDYSR